MSAHPGEIRHGSQPNEGLISAVCAEFGISPGEASKQDWLLIKKVFDYRMIERGIDHINQGAKGMKELGKNEQMQRVLLEMHRAQAPETTMDEMLAGMSDQADTVDKTNTEDDME